MNVDVVFAVTGDVRWNSRALKQLRLIAAQGYRTHAIGIGREAESVRLGDEITVQLLKRPSGTGPLFFITLHRLFRRALDPISAHLYHASDLYALPAAARAARSRGSALVYDARELYPNVAAARGRPWVGWFWQRIERRFIGEASHVFTVSHRIATRMQARYDIDRPSVLYNVPAAAQVTRSSILRDRFGIPNEKKIFLHQGNIQKDRGCFVLARAMQCVEQAALVFLGGGPLKDALIGEVGLLGLRDRVHFLDPVPPDALLSYTASADVGVTLLEDTCLNHRYALPNKLFEYLMAGIPVLASDLPEIRDVVDAYGVGRLVDPADPEAVARAMQFMIDRPDTLEQMSTNIPAVLETFSWEKASVCFEQAYHSILSDNR